MSVKIKTECPHRAECKYGDGCTLVHRGGESARFTPVLKMRVIDLETHVRCFSFISKGKGEEQ